jgi:organic hydroperoxide reductase OsmC/OhrA
MVSMTIEYRSLEGTHAAVGWAGQHALIADRPEGRARGMGLGFNGGQLLALALGGCFCNDVQYSADEMGLTVSKLEVKVTIELEGDPLVAKRAEMTVSCELADGTCPKPVIERAKARCTVAHSLRGGLEVVIS